MDWVGALIRLYPRDYRARHGAELAETMRAIAARERAAGARPLVTAVRLALDAAVSAVVLRTRHLAPGARRARHAPRAPHGDSIMQSLAQDFRYALRLLRRAPLFSALVAATLALAIGANTAIFSAVNGVLLRSLPYRDPDRLLVLYEGIRGVNQPFGFSAPDLVGFRDRARSYEAMAAFRSVEYELSGIDQPERISGARVSAGLMDVLGVSPTLGRTFTMEEDTGRQPVAILSDGLWRRAFASDPSVIGRPVLLDRRAYTVVGVMPPHFTFPHRGPALNNVPADVYVPISFTPIELGGFGMMYNNSVVARLRPGVTPAQAASEATALGGRLVSEIYPAQLREISLTMTVRPLVDDVVGNIRRMLYVLLAAVGVVLLIACADIVCLMLTRAAAREREMAIRAALGAGRGRVMRLILIETGVLAAIGGVLGLALAWWGQRVLIAAAPIAVPRASEITFDARVLAFTFATATLAALVCGVLPAFESSRRESGAALKEGGRGASAGTRQRRIFASLVTAQFACAVVLLAAGGLLIKSFVKLMSVDPGIRTDHVISAATNLPAGSYQTGADVRRFYVELVERVRRLPGVTAVGAATDLPLSVRERRAFTVENPPDATRAQPIAIANDWVMGNYFEALGVRIVRGRALSDADTLASEPVVVVNETLATYYWPGEDPVGRRVAWGNQRNHGPWMRVVGVVGDIKQAGLAAPTEPGTWQPWLQMPDQALGSTIIGVFRGMKLMVRAQVPPASLVPGIRQEVRALDPALPVTGVQTLDEIVGASASSQRFNAALLGGFAGVALLLAAVGVGGVLAISVSRRTQEIGIRLALGADAMSVIRMVTRQGMTLVAAGLAIGLPLAFAAARLLRALLFETAPHDLVAFGGATLVLCVVALAACAAPALRASRVSPVTALRID
jgi:putative ABC transport system permease protein